MECDGTAYLVWTCPLTDFMDPAVLGLNTSPHCFGYPSCHNKPKTGISMFSGSQQGSILGSGHGLWILWILWIPWAQRIRLQRLKSHSMISTSHPTFKFKSQILLHTPGGHLARDGHGTAWQEFFLNLGGCKKMVYDWVYPYHIILYYIMSGYVMLIHVNTCYYITYI